MNIPFVDLKAQYKALKSEIDGQIQKVLDHGQFIMGPEVQELEKELAQYTGSKHCITCASGTDALVIPLMAWGIKPGDEVLVPAFSFIATAEAIVLAGATPVMIDIDPVTYNMDPQKIEEAITSKTKAICPVSLYGQPADMQEINAIAKKHGLWVMEDAAQSFGASYKEKKSCNLSDVGTTSFFPAKPLGCYGDGGAIFTNDDEKADIMRSIRFHGQAERYQHVRIGMNGRMDTLQCAIMLPKLKRFPWELEQRQKIANRYTEAFKSLDNVTTPVIREDRSTAWAQYTLRVPNRSELQAALKEKGIPTAIHYPIPMSKQEAYQTNSRIVSDQVSLEASQEVMSLPMYPDMDDKTQGFIINTLIQTLRG